MTMPLLENRIKAQAQALGFELVGIAEATEADSFAQLQDWLARGYAGEMDYLPSQAEARRHPASILPSVRSIVMVGINYKPADEPPQECSDRVLGRVARYARGMDYHEILRDKLKKLLSWIRTERPEAWGRAVVDTAPLLERDFARRAGLGWFGKNTMLLHKQHGSYTLLGALLLDFPLQADEPFESAHCGSCNRCLQACPTEAFVGPYQLDARRCISYLTIELRGSIAEELRSKMEDWIFGCDVCQEVCPWNHKSPIGQEVLLQADMAGLQVDLIELMRLNEEEIRQRFRHTPLWRSQRAGLLRNAAIVLGNRKDERALPVLEEALQDKEPLIREAAQWAIQKIRPGKESPVEANPELETLT